MSLEFVYQRDMKRRGQYYANLLFMEQLHRHGHVVASPEEAALFFVPVMVMQMAGEDCGTTPPYSIVQYSIVQYSTVQYSTVQYSTVQYGTVQYSTVQYSTVQYSTVQYSIV